MQLRDTKVSIVVEFFGSEDLASEEENVTAVTTGDTGPNNEPMYKVTGTVPNIIGWLSTVYGILPEDIIISWIPYFQLEDLIP